jgi:hypothetical protein
MSYNNPAWTGTSGTLATDGYLIINPWSTDFSFATYYSGPTTYYYALPTSTSGIYAGTPILALLLSGQAGNGFNIEYIQHVEYSGQTAQSMQTLTQSDLQGATDVKTAVQQALIKATTDVGYNRTDKMYQYAVQILGDMATKAAKIGIPIVMDRMGF